jgi:hypothetical protein
MNEGKPKTDAAQALFLESAKAHAAKARALERECRKAYKPGGRMHASAERLAEIHAAVAEIWETAQSGVARKWAAALITDIRRRLFALTLGPCESAPGNSLDERAPKVDD